MEHNKIILKGIENERVKKKLGLECVYCGCRNPLILTVDHKIPLAKGGKDNDGNKQVAYFICNNLKDRLSHVQFKKYYKILIEMYDLKKVSIFLEEPKLTFHKKGYPLTKAEVERAIEKEEKFNKLKEISR